MGSHSPETQERDGPPSWRRPKTLGELQAARAMTLGKWCWLVTERRRRMRMAVAEHTEPSLIRCHVEPDPIAAIALGDLRPGDVWDYLKRISDKPMRPRRGRVEVSSHLSPRMVKQLLVLVRVALSHACEAGVLDSNPAREVHVPRGRARGVMRGEFEDVLAPEEQARVLGALDVRGWQGAMIHAAVGTGLRRSELLSLRWSDVHCWGEEPHVVVREGKDGQPTKSGKVRRVPLFGGALAALRTWGGVVMSKRQTDLPLAHAAGHHVGDDGQLSLFRSSHTEQPREGYVFPNPDGARRSGPAAVALRRALGAAGVAREVRWHSLRHTCGTSLLLGWWGRKWTPREVQALLGHASVTTTERYLHARNEAVFAAAREMRARDSHETWPTEPSRADMNSAGFGPHVQGRG